jgi:hypothetical protein
VVGCLYTAEPGEIPMVPITMLRMQGAWPNAARAYPWIAALTGVW